MEGFASSMHFIVQCVFLVKGDFPEQTFRLLSFS